MQAHDPSLLIDASVRQTTVLIRQLATTATRMTAHVATDVFVSLVEELEDQGLGSKVIADMFGLALRTYHKRVRRYSESVPDRACRHPCERAASYAARFW